MVLSSLAWTGAEDVPAALPDVADTGVAMILLLVALPWNYRQIYE
jgi:hypothetical protein